MITFCLALALLTLTLKHHRDKGPYTIKRQIELHTAQADSQAITITLTAHGTYHAGWNFDGYSSVVVREGTGPEHEWPLRIQEVSPSPAGQAELSRIVGLVMEPHVADVVISYGSRAKRMQRQLDLWDELGAMRVDSSTGSLQSARPSFLDSPLHGYPVDNSQYLPAVSRWQYDRSIAPLTVWDLVLYALLPSVGAALLVAVLDRRQVHAKGRPNSSRG